MPRRARITMAGVPVHIIQRGNNRGACFFSDDDYARYLAYLREFSAAFECAVHAYCLMTNHVHLLLTPQRAEGCALLMKRLQENRRQTTFFKIGKIGGKSGAQRIGNESGTDHVFRKIAKIGDRP